MGGQSGWSSPTTCSHRRRCSPEQLNKRWALPSGSVVHRAGRSEPYRIVRASAPSSPGTATFTRTVVPSAKRSRAARGAGAASMNRGGTPRWMRGCNREDRRRAKSRRSTSTTAKAASISVASASCVPAAGLGPPEPVEARRQARDHSLPIPRTGFPVLDRMASFFRPSASTERDFSLLLARTESGAALANAVAVWQAR